MTRPPVLAVVLCLGIACAVTAALPGRANAQPSGSTPVVQQGETPGGQAEPKEAQAKPAAPRTESAPAPRNPIADAVNVRFDVTISHQIGSQPPVIRTATLTVAEFVPYPGNSRVSESGYHSLRGGTQVAVVSKTMESADKAKGDIPPSVTSYDYRTAGISLDIRYVTVSANRVRASFGVEFSTVERADTGLEPSFPRFPTFQQNFTLVLDSGKPILVAQSSDQVDKVDRVQKVEIKATILR